MRYVVHAIAALLVAAGIVVFFLTYNYDSSTLQGEHAWYEISYIAVFIVTLRLFFILSIIHMFKPLPRLMLLLSGAAVFISFRMMIGFIIPGLLFLTGGLLTAVYTLVDEAKHVESITKQRKKRSAMLIIAGVFACLLAANFASFLVWGGGVAWSELTKISYIVQYTGAAVFCFLPNRQTNILCRMFFVGMPILTLLLTIADIVVCKGDIGYLIFFAVQFVFVLLVLIPTIKMRKDSAVPLQPRADAPTTGNYQF